MVASNAAPAYWEHAEVSSYVSVVLLLHTISARSRGKLQTMPAGLPVKTLIPQHIHACLVQSRQSSLVPHVLCMWSRWGSLRGPHAFSGYTHPTCMSCKTIRPCSFHLTMDKGPSSPFHQHKKTLQLGSCQQWGIPALWEKGRGKYAY